MKRKAVVKMKNVTTPALITIIVALALLFSVGKVALTQAKQAETSTRQLPDNEKEEIHPHRIPSKEIETKLLKQYPDKAERKAKDLFIKKDGEIIKVYTDKFPGEYILTEIKGNLFFIERMYLFAMEYGVDYFILNNATAQEINIVAMPVWSPDKNSFAVINEDESSYTTEARQLWDIENEMLIKKWGESEPATSAEWKSDDHLIITSETEGFFGWEDEVIECLRKGKNWACNKLDIITAINRKYISQKKVKERKNIYMTIAVRKNQPELVKFLFEKGYEVSENDDILWEIVGFKRMEILKMFLERMNKQDIKKYFSGGPLVHSARFAYVDILEILLKAGADPNVKTPVCNDRKWCCGNTALMELAKNREEIKLILNRDNMKFTNNKIMESEIDNIISKYPQIAELLLKYGARTDIKNAQGMDFLDMMQWHSPETAYMVKWRNPQLYEFIKKYNK